MTNTEIKEAAKKAVERGEDLQLWQALEWFWEYDLISYKNYTALNEALVAERKSKTA